MIDMVLSYRHAVILVYLRLHHKTSSLYLVMLFDV